MEPEYIKVITEIDARSKSNTHRLDKLEQMADALTAQGKSLAVMCNQLEQNNKTLSQLSQRLENLEKVPADRWERLAGAVITALVGGIIGAMLAMFS